MPLRLETPLPELIGATEWVNGQPSPEELAGHPVLVYFWSLSCHVCHENMPRLAVWRDRYRPRGLRFIAFHVPRSEGETNLALVRQQAADFGVADPCGVDNTHAVVRAFETEFIPAYFLFDTEHHLRSRTAGDAGLGLLGDTLKRLFPEE